MDIIQFIATVIITILDFFVAYWYIIVPVIAAFLALDAYDEICNDRKITNWFANH